jgi:hypothetical protein
MDEIVKFRLIETFFILKLFILKSLETKQNDKSFVMVDIPNLTKNHLDNHVMLKVK